MNLIYPDDKGKIPLSIQRDIEFLVKEVGNWRSTKKDKLLAHYKDVVSKRNYAVEQKFKSIGRKKIDLYKDGGAGRRIALEIETSTIENSYNDALKILALLQAKEIDYGIILFIQNNRANPAKLTKRQIESTWIESFGKILPLYKGKLFLYQVNKEQLKKQ